MHLLPGKDNVNVMIAGVHGQIALRLARLLIARGDRVTGLVRYPKHTAEVSEAGASPVVCDLERVSIGETGRCGDWY